MSKRQRLYLNIWDGCNLHCKHCFNYSGKVKNELLSQSEILRVIENGWEFLDIKEVQLTGGEPTERPDIFEIIKAVHKRGLKTLLQTNGTFNNNILKEILNLPDDRLSLIISLDGIETNDFFRGEHATTRTRENIRIIGEELPIRINTLLSSMLKWHEVTELATMAHKQNLTLAFNPVCPSGRSDVSHLMSSQKYFDWMYRLEELRNQGIKVRKCFDFVDGQMVENENCPVRSGHSVHVAADGSTYPCGFLVTNPTCLFGSVKDSSLAELKNKIPSHCKVLAAECLTCDFLKRGYCHGGCPARINSLHGRFNAADIYCMAKYFQN